MWAAWRADSTWSPPGGESLAALGVRVRAACAGLVDEAAGRDVVVVTHVSPIKAAVAWALGVGDEVAWRMWVAPASITRIGVGPDAVAVAAGLQRAGPPGLTAGGEPAPTTGHAWPWKERRRISPVARSIVASQKQVPPSDT